MSFHAHPAIATYQGTLQQLKTSGFITESQTRRAFATLLESICQERQLLFVEEFPVGKRGRKRVDGVVRDTYSSLGYWEAKDESDDLETEIINKIAAGYPLSNTIFEDTQRAILWQDQREVARFDLRSGAEVAQLLESFFNHSEQDKEGFDAAVAAFVDKIPELARALLKKIYAEDNNSTFQEAFANFFVICQSTLDPNIKEDTVREMLVQHLLTERLFRTVFSNPEWVQRNIIAREIETVIAALTSQSWSRAEFLRSLDPFYKAIESRARTLPDYSSKQGFLNTVYERFFQGYSPETADTMGIVYTPQEIVDWMCSSVECVLQEEWKTSLSTPGVKILDPCTGTGNFIINLLGRIDNVNLPQKYSSDLFANEIMLLPYYVASGNIEHEYYDRFGEYRAFEGLCFADTLDMMESDQVAMFAPANTERVENEKSADITVIIGNPPYNMGQENENDNNKNRSYKGIKGEKGVDDLIADSYVKHSEATLRSKLYDPYVRFFCWAAHRLNGRDGVICFVSNNSFVEQFAFDGMRKILFEEFNHIWHLDLHGNVRKNPKLSGTMHNVFGIQVGVGITILCRNSQSEEHFLRYHRVPEFWTKKEKLACLEKSGNLENIEWDELTPNARHVWLTEGLEADFEEFTPLGTKEAKRNTEKGLIENKTIFNTYSLGVNTARDEWIYDFYFGTLAERIPHFIDFYNLEVRRWQDFGDKRKVHFDNFVNYDDKKIKWSSTLKNNAKRGVTVGFSEKCICPALYRPFCKQYLYYDEMLIDRQGAFQKYFLQGKANRVICLSGAAHSKPFQCLMTNQIPALDLLEKTQCFPLYSYSTDGKLQHENVTRYALEQARRLYGAEVTREDIFYAVYALLHHPTYREKYAENLKQELPRLPLFVDNKLDFAAYARIGRQLGDLHVDYESVEPYDLKITDTTPKGRKFSFRVEKMKFSKDKSTLVVNDSISISGFTPKMFEYRLGTRSALDWIVDRYRVKTDKRSGIVSDPNRADEPKYILDLIAKVATVSLETQRLVRQLPEWDER